MVQRKRVDIAGFSLIELLITITIMLIVAAMGFPALLNLIHRSKIETASRQISTVMQVAKLEAIKTGRQAIVVIDTTNQTIQAYVNVDESADRAYDPDDTKTFRTVDYQLRLIQLAAGLELKGPGGVGEALEGCVHPEGGPDMLIFSPNGSVEDECAIRIGDPRGNFLESNVSPKSTARIELRKYDPDLTPPDDWIGRRDGDKPWTWY